MNDSPVMVRVLTAEDAEEYWRIRLEALETEPLAFTESAAEHRATTVATTAARLNPSVDKFMLGAFVDGRLVGTTLFRRLERKQNRHRAGIHAVYVKPEFRGKAVARAMFEELLRKARLVDGIEQLELVVGTTQTVAKRLYQAMGFEVVGRAPRAVKLEDGRYVDHDVMVLQLS